MREGNVQRYTRIARLLHWGIAALVIANILIGIVHEPLGEVFSGSMGIHKAIGITVLALTVVRIGWRLSHPAPPLPLAMPAWERGAAHVLHLVFYAVLLILPVTGWIMVSAGERPLTWFWLFDIPKLAVTKGDALVTASRAAHGTLGLVFGALALLHIAAALRHHFVLRDGVLRRMLG